MSNRIMKAGSFVIALSLVALATGTGCGQLKTRDEPVVNVPVSPEAAELQQAYDMYKKVAGDPWASAIQQGQGRDGGPNDGPKSIAELTQHLYERIPSFNWIPADEEVDAKTFAAGVQESFPTARPLVIQALTQAFFRFDQLTLRGNGNGRLSREEAMIPGIVLGTFVGDDDEDAPKGGSGLWKEMIRVQLEKQKLSLMDAAMTPLRWNPIEEKLEMGRFGIRLSAHLNSPVPHMVDVAFWYSYDKKIAGGDEDGQLDGTETFAALSDLQWVDGIRKRPMNRGLLSYLHGIFPRVGPELLGVTFPNAFFWERDKGSKRTVSQLARAFNRVLLVDQIFREYDVNRTTMLEPTELKKLYLDLGVPEAKGIEGVAMGIAQRAPNWIKNKLFPGLELLNTNHSLHPYELYTRLEKLEMAL